MRGPTSRKRMALVVAFLVGVVLAVVPGKVVESDSEFVPLAAPVRLLDTRPGSSTIDGAFAGIGRR
ncbi:MAG: hypothetical protein ACR2O6_15670, partial [Ilumatobacteraceae bacterium]